MNFRTFTNIVLFSVLSVSAYAEGDAVDETKDAEADGYVDISVVRGSVRLKGWDQSSIRVVGTLDEETKAFIFEVDGGENLSLESISGDIEVTTKLLSAVGGHSVSGDISVSGDPGSGAIIEFDSVSGDIRLMLGGDINARFDLETGSGSIRNRISDDESRSSKYLQDETLRFTIGDGEGQVTLSTHSGDIALGRR